MPSQTLQVEVLMLSSKPPVFPWLLLPLAELLIEKEREGHLSMKEWTHHMTNLIVILTQREKQNKALTAN
jgi:hypothetical protein